MGLQEFTRLVVCAAVLCACSRRSGTATPAATATPRAATAATTGNGGCYSADASGADPTGTQPSDGAITQILGAIGTGTGCIQFGPGSYTFANPVQSLAASSLAIRGAGSSITTLSWLAATGGLYIVDSVLGSINVSGLKLTTSAAKGGTALIFATRGCLSNIPSNVEDVVAVGDDYDGGYQSHYWGCGLATNSVSFVNVRGLTVIGGRGASGVGIVFTGSQASCPAVVMNVSQSNFSGTDVGVQYGENAQGLAVTQCNFTNGTVGITDAGGTYTKDQLVVSDSQFNVTANAIDIHSPVNHVYVHGCQFDVASGVAGISINTGTTEGFGYTFQGEPVHGCFDEYGLGNQSIF